MPLRWWIRARRVERAALIVVVWTSLIAATRFLLDDWLAENLPYLLFLGAVAASTRWAGWVAGAAATLLSGVAGTYFFSEPRMSVHVGTEDALVELVVFVAVSAAVVTMLETEGRLRRKVQLANQRLTSEHAQRVNAERELESARRLESIGRLAGGVAHDFNNLLTVVMGSAELLRMRLPDDPLLESIAVAATQGADLTKQLLRFARREPLQLSGVSLNESVHESESLLRRLLPSDIEIELGLHSDVWSFNGDRSQLQQVLLNLATNARDAMPQGGKLSIQTDNVTLNGSFTAEHPEVSPGEYVLLKISDNGSGLSDEARQRLFEPFFTTKQGGHGTGLGLAVTYGIIKQLQGHVYVHSQPGAGTTFEIYWPRLREELAQPKQGQLAAVSAASRPLTVLVVDDDEAVLAVTAELIRRLGHQVIAEAGPAAALKALRDYAGPLDVLVTDVVMPWMNGREFADRVALMRPGTPAVFISGYTDNVILSRGVVKPGTILVRKPFNKDDIERALRAALANKRTEPLAATAARLS